ncbi:MAG: UPF0149 family protein [Gammaproteobacteria bacterium]|nr:UPF0149 family protein [Gammaproteobacteria bacterium]
MQALSSLQQQQLNSWLLEKSPNGTLSLTAVKGYLFAVIASPDPIEVSQWLSTIFNHNTDTLPDEITLSLATLYNEISDQMFDSGISLPDHIEYSDLAQANFLAGHPLHEWSLGFACGLNFYSQKLLESAELSSELLESFSLAIMALTFFADHENADAVVSSQQQSTIDEFAPLMYQLINDLVPEYAQLVEQVALSSGLYDEAEDDWN